MGKPLKSALLPVESHHSTGALLDLLEVQVLPELVFRVPFLEDLRLVGQLLPIVVLAVAHGDCLQNAFTSGCSV